MSKCDDGAPESPDIYTAERSGRRQSKEERQHAAALAWIDQNAKQRALNEQIARLRSIRLARGRQKL